MRFGPAIAAATNPPESSTGAAAALAHARGTSPEAESSTNARSGPSFSSRVSTSSARSPSTSTDSGCH